MYIKDKKDHYGKLLAWLTVIISMLVAVLFCNLKQGYHYDENYSYYSTDVTYGLWPTDNEWKSTQEIKSEYMILPGESLNLGLVKLNQTYDVHPPLYYFILRIVCFFSKGVFSKWQGLGINLVFYFLCLILLWKIADIVSGRDSVVNIATLAIFGLSPGYLSTVTFIRMYVMLTVMCFTALLIAMLCIRDNSWTLKKAYIPTIVITFMGFMTHYYYIVFAFFLTAYVCIYLVIKKETRVKAFIYGGSVCAGLIFAVLYYPACLGHIFSGYRGTESKQAFLDMSNTAERINFFVQMLNDYTFSGMFYILLLVALLLYMFYAYRRKVRWANRLVNAQDTADDEVQINAQNQDTFADSRRKVLSGLLLTVTLGYFLIVCKTAMTPSNPAEALRYESPVYGLIILLVVYGIVIVFARVTKNRIIACGVMVIAVICQIHGLCSDKVFFLYKGAQDNIHWAEEHAEADIVYIYNPGNSWMIWNDGPELMSYRDIFFIPYDAAKPITDKRLLNSREIYVYACRSDESDAIIKEIAEKNSFAQGYEKISERAFVDIYKISGADSSFGIGENR